MNQDVDSGYAWVILASCFFSQICVGGCSSIYGQFYLELGSTFHESAESLMMVVAVQSFTLYGASLFAGILCTPTTLRPIGLIGVSLACLGYVIAAHSNHLPVLILGYGFFGGLGISLHNMAAMTIVQIYFDKKRNCAAGLASSGIGIGIMLFAPAVQYFIQSYGWRGAMLLVGGIYLQSLVFVALMRPLNTCLKSPKKTPTPKPMPLAEQKKFANEVYASNASINLSRHDLTDTPDPEKLISNMAAAPEEEESKTAPDQTEPDTEQAEPGCLAAKCKIMAALFDYRLLTNFYVLLFFLASVTMSVANGIPYNFLPVKCIEDGLTKADAAWVISLMGVSDMLGRAIFGVIAVKIHVTVLYAVTCAMGMVTTMLLAWIHSFAGIAIVSMLFAFGQGGVSTLGMQSIVKYVGVKNFSRVIGFIMVGKTVGYGAGGPFGAYLSEAYSSSSMIFFVVSFFPLASCLITCVILVVTRLQLFPLPVEEEEKEQEEKERVEARENGTEKEEKKGESTEEVET